MKTRPVHIAGVLVLVLVLVQATASGLQARPDDAFLSNAAAKPDNCLTCHRATGEAAGMKYAGDIHMKKGITCAGCHGGDPTTADQEKAMSADRGFIGAPKGNDVSKMCQRCHSDAVAMKSVFNSGIAVHQLESLDASVHGGASTSGDGRMVQCVTCHGVHNIKAVADPQSPVNAANVNKTCAGCHSNAVFMRNYNPGLPIDQEEKYKTSVHGMKHAKGDLKTAVCSSCHGSHDILKAVDAKSHVNAANLPVTCGKCHADAGYMKEYSIPTDQVAEYKLSVHGKALLEKHDLGAPSCNDCHGNHGAAPPEVKSVSQVCGTCHAMNAELFSASPHKKAFDEMGMPECETCHGNHAIVNASESLLGVTGDAICAQCHSETDNAKGYKAAALMRIMADSLDRAERRADSLVGNAEQRGMEVSEARFKLRDVHQARLQSRTAVHAFNEGKFAEVVNGGIAKAGVVAAEGQAGIDEFFFRRYGLGVATLVITVLAFAFWAYIKKIEREQAGGA